MSEAGIVSSATLRLEVESTLMNARQFTFFVAECSPQ